MCSLLTKMQKKYIYVLVLFSFLVKYLLLLVQKEKPLKKNQKEAFTSKNTKNIQKSIFKKESLSKETLTFVK
jgi:hypothetical protein